MNALVWVLNIDPGSLSSDRESKQGPFDAHIFCKTLESRNVYESKGSETEIPPN